MGNYNPHLPYILGEEWVPIREEDVQFSPSADFVELGHEFTLTGDTRIRDARFYINQYAPMPSTYQTVLVNIYPRGTETSTGPIQELLIPCNNGGMTGGNFVLQNASGVAQALLNPGDARFIEASYNSGTQQDLSMFFAVNSYPQLANKRILNVSLIYSGYMVDSDGFTQIPLIDPDVSTQMTLVGIYSTAGPLQYFARFFSANNGMLWQLSNTINQASGSTSDNQTFGVVNLGDINTFYPGAPVYSGSGSTVGPVVPWRYADLQLFEATSGTGRLHVHVIFQIPATGTSNLGRIALEYAALRVQYCEETRAVYGGTMMTSLINNFGTNVITLRDLSLNADPVLPAGDYVMTISAVNPGDRNFGTGLTADFPKLNGLRELYAVPPQRGVQINVPAPLEDHLGETFVRVDTTVLPQLTLHTSGGPVTAVHAYGRQVQAQVYGSVTPEQEIYDDALPGSMVFDQVRFYARRFGDTTVPLEVFGVGGTTGSASITPADFDALDEIINGWKEVTLPLSPASTMGTLAPPAPRFRFQAAGELPGNRWEVLGASAPALSGLPGNLYGLAPAAQQLYEATYQPPGGSQAELSWLPQGIGSPPVTAISDDDTSDAVLMFAQSMPTITGFTASVQSQQLVGIGLNCGINPCCIPSALLYNNITWALPVNTGVALDNFDRTVAAGSWGTATDGKVWTLTGTAGNFSVNSANGIISPSATASQRIATVVVGGPDQDVKVLTKINGTSEGTGSLRTGVVARWTDANNFYAAELWYTQNATAELHIRKVVAGVNSDIVSMTLKNINPNTVAYRWIRLQVRGQYLMASCWGASSDEPDFMLTATDTSLVTGNSAGCFARDDTTAAAPNSMSFEDFTVNPPNFWFGSYELQRQDTVDTTWQTIMRATAPYVTGFRDYEARVGVVSSYRIRGVDVYDFAGPWSSTVSATIPTPGASGGCISSGHVLLFSSNERQDGSVNLAYASVWESRVEEDFTFPEANFVQMQAMYNRNNFIAFRPTERGGEQFQRTVLVQAAAISPPTLADFTSLRDMAWEDTSYICVRDEDGNRWFATVLVPSGKVTHFRKLYMAPVTIIEVTDTPSEADPAS